MLPLALAFPSPWRKEAQVTWYTYVSRCASYFTSEELETPSCLSEIEAACRQIIAEKDPKVRDVSDSLLRSICYVSAKC